MPFDWTRIRTIYVDGYNLLFFLYPQPSLDFDQKRTRLVDQVQQIAKKRNISILFIFDGKEGGRSRGMRFTEGQTADDELIQIAKTHRESKKILIVSSDQKIRYEVNAVHVPAIDSKTFWKWLNSPENNEFVSVEELHSPKNVQEFLSEFSEEEALLNSINSDTEDSIQVLPPKIPPEISSKKKKTILPQSLEINTDKYHTPTEGEMLFWLKEFESEED